MFLDRVAAVQANRNKANLPKPNPPAVSALESESSASCASSTVVVDKASAPSSPKEKSTDESKAPQTSTSKDSSLPRHSFSDSDLDRLARRANLNGRQIKNAVRSAQALAVNAGEPLAITHLLQVLDVAESFERDLKGGTGYSDAMRSYM